MKLNNIWGYGQLFGFSAFDGPNRYYDDNILMTMKEPLKFRFEYKPYWISFCFPNIKNIEFKYVMSDFVVATCDSKEFVLTFVDNDTLVGISPVLPVFDGESNFEQAFSRNVLIYSSDRHFLGFLSKKIDEGYLFVIHHSFSASEARSLVNAYIDNVDVHLLLEKKISYYKNLPECKNKEYESLYYKCLSINKVNTHTPEGRINRFWTTPDRVPHRHMWLWDSVFHAWAMSTYNHKAGEDAFLAMLSQMRPDGFMPHMANPTDYSDVTQPCVMAYGALEIYKRTQNIKFLQEAVTNLDKYLTYDLNNRDVNHNHLLEWKTEAEYTECKCGESGLDNSPRFDFDEEMDCIDFSTYFALDAKCLSKIYQILGNKKEATKWLDLSNDVSSNIQTYLWDEETGMFYDRLFSGKLTKVLTHSSFLPLFAGIASKEQAERMVKTLIDPSLLWTEFPLASISKKDPRFGNDMWRGGVWLNINYFIIIGLRKYGYFELADELRKITLERVNEWYLKTGVVFEFYDAENKVSPFMCHRKGEPLQEPDYRKHVHSISDYNWSACFTLLLIQEIYE